MSALRNVLMLFVFSSSMAFAQTSDLKPSDKEVLFGSQESAQIATLSKEEMQEIQGEFWPALLYGLGIGLGTLAINCILGDCGEFETAGTWNF